MGKRRPFVIDLSDEDRHALKTIMRKRTVVNASPSGSARVEPTRLVGSPTDSTWLRNRDFRTSDVGKRPAQLADTIGVDADFDLDHMLAE